MTDVEVVKTFKEYKSGDDVLGHDIIRELTQEEAKSYNLNESSSSFRLYYMTKKLREANVDKC